ncbi:hypothetical protein A2U01_0113566, partial [Trifolium medium]|nr:hypothetical protein [Trifolium medium]
SRGIEQLTESSQPPAHPTEEIHPGSSVSLPDIGNPEQTVSPALPRNTSP